MLTSTGCSVAWTFENLRRWESRWRLKYTGALITVTGRRQQISIAKMVYVWNNISNSFILRHFDCSINVIWIILFYKNGKLSGDPRGITLMNAWAKWWETITLSSEGGMGSKEPWPTRLTASVNTLECWIAVSIKIFCSKTFSNIIVKCI